MTLRLFIHILMRYHLKHEQGKERKRKMKICKATTQEQIELVYRLYIEAFPEVERKPFPLLLEKQRQGKMELDYIASDEEDFLGLAIFIFDRELVLLDYFAIASNQRNSGTGSMALQLLMERFEEKTFLLEAESTLSPAKNQEQRLKRKAFYLRNGMVQTDLLISISGVEMEVYTTGKKLEFQSYCDIYRHVFSKGECDKVPIFVRTLE